MSTETTTRTQTVVRPGEQLAPPQLADSPVAKTNAPDAEGAAPEEEAGGTDPQILDAVRYLLDRYEISERRNFPSTIAVVSALAGEGVTTVSHALADALAHDYDQRVCWVDLSWIGSSSPATRSGEPGLAELLSGDLVLADFLNHDDDAPEIVLLPPGGREERADRFNIRGIEFDDLFDELRQVFDVVVIDAPPVLANADALAALMHADSHLFVARHGSTSSGQVEEAVTELRTIPPIGAVLNGVRRRTPRWIRRRFAR